MTGRNRQIERGLQREVAMRLANAPLKAIVQGSANGIYIPARTPAERALAARIIHQLKLDGAINPGAADLTVLWKGGCGLIELKRPSVNMLTEKIQRGRASPEQVAYRQQCEALGIPYVICDSWLSVRATLVEWGVLPEAFGRAA